MDSKAAVLFSSRLAEEMPSLRLPATLVFDHPTLAAIAAYAAGESTATATGRVVRHASPDELLAVIGTACAFPGASSG